MTSREQAGTMGTVWWVVAIAFAVLPQSGCRVCGGCGCEADEDCAPRGEYCVDMRCVQCREDRHCQSERKMCRFCDRQTNTCQHRPGCCMSDLDCPGGRCWTQPGQETGQCGCLCKQDSDCPPGQICQDCLCVPRPCDNSYQCEDATLRHCVAGFCRLIGKCRTDRDCSARQMCVTGRCEHRCKLEPVYFDFNETTLRPDARSQLEQNAACMKLRGHEVKLKGHHPPAGDVSTGLALAISSRRAHVVKTFLVKLGVPAAKISTLPCGKDEAPPNCTSEACWERQRRVDCVFVRKHRASSNPATKK